MVQASESSSGNEITSENPLHFDINLPISTQKRGAKYPLYPILKFVSFDNYSLSHKRFLMSLST